MVNHPGVLEISRMMRDEPVVFIVGQGRSGTSILYRILQQHSRFRVRNCEIGVDLTEPKTFVRPDFLLERHEVQGVGALSYMLFDEERFAAFRHSVRWTSRLLFWGRSRGFLKPAPEMRWTTRALLWKLSLNQILLRAFYYFAREARGVERLLDKTPENVNRYPEIFATLPNARIIHIVRHPVDVFTSYRRRLHKERARGGDPDDLEWLDISVPNFCFRFRRILRMYRAAEARFSSSIFFVRYEDITAAPEETITGILGFLGEEFEPACIVADETSRVSWDVDPDLFGKITPRTKDWADFLTREELDGIQDRLSDLMSELGYEPYRLAEGGDGEG